MINIILNKIIEDNSINTIQEIYPQYDGSLGYLSFDGNIIKWTHINFPELPKQFDQNSIKLPFVLGKTNKDNYKISIDKKGIITADNFQLKSSLNFKDLLDVIAEQQIIINDMREAILELQDKYLNIKK